MAPVLAPRRLHMLFCIGGILGSLLLYGVLQVPDTDRAVCCSSEISLVTRAAH